MLLNCGVGKDPWESLGLQGDPTSPFYRKSVLNMHWKDWCWSWSSNTLAIWCKELTHWERPWCWERLKAGGEGDEKGWDDWTASLTQWTWFWASSGSWWRTGKPGMLQSMGSLDMTERLNNTTRTIWIWPQTTATKWPAQSSEPHKFLVSKCIQKLRLHYTTVFSMQ